MDVAHGVVVAGECGQSDEDVAAGRRRTFIGGEGRSVTVKKAPDNIISDLQRIFFSSLFLYPNTAGWLWRKLHRLIHTPY